MYKGIGVSDGIAYAKALLLINEEIVVPAYKTANPSAEVSLFDQALQKVIADKFYLKEKALKDMGENEAAIFDAHCAILQDEASLVQPIKDLIQIENYNAAAAIEKQMNEIIEMFSSMDDEYMRERSADAADIKHQLLRCILGIESHDLSSIKSPCIIIAHDLTPSDTIRMDKQNVLGFVTETGGRTSHTALLAQTLEIPAIVGAKNVLELVKAVDLIMIDGSTGEIKINPNSTEIAMLEKKKNDLAADKEQLEKYRGKLTLTSDGKKCELSANIGDPEYATLLLDHDAEGIGLFRSEFFYMNQKDLPDEELQFQAYKKVLSLMGTKPVIVRTLDIGGDKELPSLDLPKEENPFLGCRAIRLCLKHKDIFKVQLRALMRASVYGNLHIMFPMISCIEELREAKKVLSEIKKELASENIKYSEHVPVGMMVEIPSTALLADEFAKEADFFSIGTNDLIQYTVAVDRGNEQISHLYTPFHPAVIHLIANTISAAHKRGIWCGMCGEAASDEKLTPLWIGLGLDELSMSSTSILKIRRRISMLDSARCKQLAQEVLHCSTAQEVCNMLSSLDYIYF